jgi:hypothetical protein
MHVVKLIGWDCQREPPTLAEERMAWQYGTSGKQVEEAEPVQMAWQYGPSGKQVEEAEPVWVACQYKFAGALLLYYWNQAVLFV